jgi:hypothetical protein
VTAALLILRVGLAAVLGLAGVAKFLDRAGSRDAVRAFGVPERAAGVVVRMLPLVELLIAVALFPRPTARWAALSAVGLLAVFCVAIVRALARGERPECACFGRVHSAPVGGGTLVRNAALAAVAGLIAAAGPGTDIGGALASVEVTPLGVAVVLVLLALVLQGWFGWQLFRQNGRLIDRVRTLEESVEGRGARRREPSGLPVGEAAPNFELSDLGGRRRTLEDLLAAGLPVALVFSDSECGACAGLAPQLARLREAREGSLEIALITRGGVAENRAQLNGSRFEHVLLQREREVLEAYRVDAVPSATIVDPQGRIASPTVRGDLAIDELLASSPVPRQGPLRVAAG